MRLFLALLGLLTVVFVYQPIFPLPLGPLSQDQVQLLTRCLVYLFGLASSRLSQALTISLILYKSGFVPPLVFIDDFLSELLLSNPTISQSTWDAAFFGGLLSLLILISPGSSARKKAPLRSRKKVPRSTVPELGDPADPALLTSPTSKPKPNPSPKSRRSLSPPGSPSRFSGKPETPLQRARREAREAHEVAVEQHITNRRR
ncbi:hypothetical protein TrRE_jg10645 [Triparma retinervis]|uniref:Uncharacterized protein n=1 Tax=Triparma retinervis TaxID=2557542 RepID=A0A9W7CHN2_9STRA|nr:hypothetical protein TrRE_jg10645 [Triparma retinervis]